MNKVYLIAIAVVALASCKKGEQLSADRGCISQVLRQNYNLSSADSATSIQLLKKNGIVYSDLQLEYYTTYTIADGSNPGTHQDVFTVQQVNRVPILSGEIWYDFNNGILQTTNGTLYPSIDLDTRSSSSAQQLRTWYLSELNKTNTYNAAAYKDSCLVAVFGYYDLNVNINHSPDFAKAWRIKPKHSDYPQLTVQDGSGKLISYFSGLVFFD